MLTSASATPQAALAKVFAGFTPECSSPSISSDPALSPLCRISRYIFQATHSSRIPPARTSPTIWSNWETTRAKAMRSTSAAATPMTITFRRCSAGRPAASAPTTIALSPARTISISRIWISAESAPGGIMERSIAETLAEREHLPQAQDVLTSDPALVNHVARNPQDHGEADVIDPVMALDELGDIVGSEAHEEHGKAQTHEQESRVLARDRGDQQHVIEAHAEVGDGDRDRGLDQGLA